MTAIVGIDCATEDKKVGLARGKFVGGCVEVSEALSNFKAGEVLLTLRRWIDPSIPTLLAIDAPLGWPQRMGETLVAHQAGEAIAVEANQLFRRRTDVYIKERLSQQPLDVGADRIARTAHRALRIIAELGAGLSQPVDLAWEPSLHGVAAIEVYPAATLVSYKIPARCYKEEGAAEARRNIVDRLGDHIASIEEHSRVACLADADVLDAVVCVLAGADFLRGQAEAPRQQDREVTYKEGWIWCRTLEVLPPNPRFSADARRPR
jgi:predicted RNase H-like nuclease